MLIKAAVGVLRCRITIRRPDEASMTYRDVLRESSVAATRSVRGTVIHPVCTGMCIDVCIKVWTSLCRYWRSRRGDLAERAETGLQENCYRSPIIGQRR